MPTKTIKCSPIKVYFKTGIRADGELTVVRLTQFDEELQLTEKQAITLAKQILNRFESDLSVK